MGYRVITTIALVGVIFLAGCASASPNTPAEDKGIETTATPSPVDATPTVIKPDSTGSSDSAGESAGSPLEPLPNESEMIRGGAFVTKSEIILMESSPVQVELKVTGTLPTPCHQLRATVSEPDADNNIYVEIYSLTDPDTICIQMLEPFDTSIPLGSFETGGYTVYLNNAEVGKFSV